MNTMPIVLIGDIIQSRKQFNPQQWEQFHKAIEGLNSHFKPHLSIPLVVYSGDSFGAVVKDPLSALHLILKIQEAIKPLKARLTLIEDEVSYGLDKKSFLELEGPALWKSQQKLQELKESGAYFLGDLQNPLISLSINALLNLILSIKNDWSNLEWDIYHQYPDHKNQQEIASQHGVSQQYISKLIRQSKFKLVKESEKNLILLLNGITDLLDGKR